MMTAIIINIIINDDCHQKNLLGGSNASKVANRSGQSPSAGLAYGSACRNERTVMIIVITNNFLDRTT
jgi:hypothetical protein